MAQPAAAARRTSEAEVLDRVFAGAPAVRIEEALANDLALA